MRVRETMFFTDFQAKSLKLRCTFESHPSAGPALERDMLSGNCPGPSAAGLRDHETEMFLHRREIAVVV